MGSAVDVLDDVGRIRDAEEDEVVVVAGRGVEVDVAHLEQPLQGRLVVVHVLDPLQARLLDVARDDAPLDVEAASGDRVVRRHPLDEAGQHDRCDPHHGDQDH